MNDATRRALRSLFQVGLVTAFVQLLIAFNVPVTAQQQAAIVAFATPLLVLVQNLLEDAGSIPAYGKAPASPGANPVPDPRDEGKPLVEQPGNDEAP
jgi:hypothetical protein